MEELELLSDDEVKELILALVKGQGAASDEDMKAVVDWAQDIRIGASLLECVLSGLLVVAVRDGEMMFQKREGTGGPEWPDRIN